MESVATSVRITATANALLGDLATRTRKSKAQVVEEALRQMEDRLFWEQVQAAFAQPEPERLKAERELWDRTASDGFRRRKSSR